MMFSLLHTFCLHLYRINIHIFDYPDSRLSGLFTAVPTSPDNRGSTVVMYFIRATSLLAVGYLVLPSLNKDFIIITIIRPGFQAEML